MSPSSRRDLLRVRLAVLTYQRPLDMAAALPLLLQQALGASQADLQVDLLVVDNDPAASARALVTRVARQTEVAVHYEHEPTPGIAAARNRALDAAGDVDVLVFIDDDERPSPQWLSLLLQTYRRHSSAAVIGPVVSEFTVEPGAWVTAGRFFQRLRRPTGTAVSVAATNNLLLDLHQVRALGLRFDAEFGLSGGSDTLFTRALHRHGGQLIWCDEAVVTDVVPPDRATPSWVMKRALRSGNSWSRTSLALTDSARARLVVRLLLTGGGLLRLAGAAVRFGAGVLTRSLALRARGARTLARSLGMLAGAWGYVYSEYRRPVASAQTSSR